MVTFVRYNYGRRGSIAPSLTHSLAINHTLLEKQESTILSNMKFTIPFIVAVFAAGTPAAPTPVSLNPTPDAEIQNL
jgi:hypothetical protein